MSRMGTSCAQIANMGNLESDYYLIDNDGVNGNLPPYTAFCKMPERQTFVGMINHRTDGAKAEFSGFVSRTINRVVLG